MKNQNLCEKIKRMIKTGCISILTFVSPLTAMAGNDISVALTGEETIGTLVGSVIGTVLDLARYVGIILLIFGLYQLYLSFKDDNPDGKIKAITLLVTSVGLMTIKMILVGLGVIKID